MSYQAKDTLWFNSLWPSDSIWHQCWWAAVIQVKACHLMTLCHYLKQYCVIISDAPWHLPKGNFTKKNISNQIVNKYQTLIITAALPSGQEVNSLWPSDAIWWQRSGSTLAQVMACCLMASSHYLNQCWLIINKVVWHSSKGMFTRDTSAINHWNYLEN